MADRNAPKKHGKSGDAREERLKAALKANMARRKAQAKARASADDKADKDEG
ncbi:hypothetical protein RUE5091_04072 [Ruegeria denitrificans]|uniref:Amidase n=1 Tax=Ruegeria denitrificans TaxID=1715692 RepID=A0A0P1IJN2_9RHOB|nr:hypothetical protein [Ruegeria denitrificans]CUK17016.1 hypothetical protein RUE5091_04072 [Ruegeria denitrificans]